MWGWTAVPAVAAAAWAVRGRSSEMFGNSVWRGPADRRAIALTFDDGPSESTPELLDVLDAHGARATFFVCGANVNRLPALVRDTAVRGHEIGNHSDTHPLLCAVTPAGVRNEIARAQEKIIAATGVTPRWFRAPYGVRWFGVGAAQRQMSLTGAMWTVLARDWTLPAAAIAARVETGAGPGAIVCLHDGRALRPQPDVRQTIDGVRALLPRLTDQGYTFVTLTQLCPTSPPES